MRRNPLDGLEPDEAASLANRSWAAAKKRYQIRDGDNEEEPEEDKDLEADLFDESQHVLSGIKFSVYSDIKVKVHGEGPAPIDSFAELNIHQIIKENIMKARYKEPTPVQVQLLFNVRNMLFHTY